jgi:hypothetical protein
VSCIAAEVRKDTSWTDWDAGCFTEYRKLLELESIRLGDVFKEQGAEEVWVQTEWKVRDWIAESLEEVERAREFPKE